MSKIRRENIITLSITLVILIFMAIATIIGITHVPELVASLCFMLLLDGMAIGICAVCLSMVIRDE